MAIKIECAFTDRVSIKNLKPNPLNPNEHPEEQIKLLAEIIKQVGWRDPITISNRSGFIVRGHGRFAAAVLLKMASVPVEYHDYDSEEEELADLVMDNKIKELSYLDRGKVRDLLSGFEDSSRRLMTGFNEVEIEKIMHGGGQPPPSLGPGAGSGSGGGGGTSAGDKGSEGDGAGSGEKNDIKYYRLPLMMSMMDRAFVMATLDAFQIKNRMNEASDALLRIIQEYQGGA